MNIFDKDFKEILGSQVVSIIGGIIAGIFLASFHNKLILIAVIAGIIANIIEIIITLVVTFYLFRKGHDPNNVMGPFLTSTGDISSIIALLIAMVIV